MPHRRFYYFLHTALFIVCSIFSVNSFAEKINYYIGLNAGVADFPLTLNNQTNVNTNSTYSTQYNNIENSNASLGILLGVRFHRYYGIELELLDLGQMQFTRNSLSTNNINGTSYLDSLRVKESYSGLALSHIAHIPLSQRITLNGKLGVYALNRETVNVYDYRDFDNLGAITTQYSYTINDKKLAFTGVFGIGVTTKVANSFAFQAKWERYFSVIKIENGDDIDNISIGFIYFLNK